MLLYWISKTNEGITHMLEYAGLSSTESSKLWGSILGFVSEMKRCDEAGLTTASLAMAFICIDSIANLSRPAGNKWVTRSDFKNWVELHLKGHPEQPYQYRGKDVYAARCAFLHTYGSKAKLHEEDPDILKYGYHNGGKHNFNPKVAPGMVLIGTKSFINDIVHAVESFLEQCKTDTTLRKRVESRLVHFLRTRPYPIS